MVETKRLGDIATYINGYAFKPDDWCKEGLPIVRIQDLTGTSYQQNYYKGDYPAKIEINDGDVLISWSASLGVHIWDRGKALLNQHIFKVVFDKVEVDKQYFVYAVQYNLENMLSKMHGATMKHIVKKDFDNIEVPFPTLVEQKRVASILAYAKDAIEDRKQQLTKLDNLVKSRFVEMFGDPLLNDRGWPCKRIGDLFEVISRGKQPTYVEHSTVRVINQACVYWDRINMDNAKYHDNQSSKKMLPISEYSILINSTGTGTLGRCNVFPELRDDYVYVVDSHVTTLQESSEINAWFFKWFFQHNGIQAKIYSECVNGSTNQIELSREKLSNAMMIVPPIELQNQFAEFVIETNKSKVAIQAALDKTQLLFDSLMQEYFG